jgi:hypothetical protein
MATPASSGVPDTTSRLGTGTMVGLPFDGRLVPLFPGGMLGLDEGFGVSRLGTTSFPLSAGAVASGWGRLVEGGSAGEGAAVAAADAEVVELVLGTASSGRT